MISGRGFTDTNGRRERDREETRRRERYKREKGEKKTQTSSLRKYTKETDRRTRELQRARICTHIRVTKYSQMRVNSQRLIDRNTILKIMFWWTLLKAAAYRKSITSWWGVVHNIYNFRGQCDILEMKNVLMVSEMTWLFIEWVGDKWVGLTMHWRSRVPISCLRLHCSTSSISVKLHLGIIFQRRSCCLMISVILLSGSSNWLVNGFYWPIHSSTGSVW